MSSTVQLLADHGTRLGENITKHLEDDIWELRPGNNRVLYFYHKDDTYVLLHQFRKKTQKTPRREIEKAKAERDDWISRRGGVTYMATWSDYKNHVRANNPEIAKDIDEIEVLSQIVGAMIEQRHNLNLSQRDLAELCGLPHSSVARIESGKSTPNLSTLLKIFRQLGLSFTVNPVSPPATLGNSKTSL